MTKPKSVSKRSKAAKSRVSAVKRRAANVPASQQMLDAQEALAKMRVELVPLALIDEDPGNRRGEPVTNESVEGLAQTIRWAYMGEPVKLRPSENGRYLLWDGHRRFRAHQVLGLEKIAAIVREDWSELDAVLGTILNVQRQPLDPWSEALAVKAARDLMEGVTAETLAQRLGLPVTRVKLRLALADLPERVALALVERGRHDGDSVGIVRSVIGPPNAPTVGDENIIRRP